jgi:NAD(P)-dependent dehydrogenase (short-subunit alcohol dehydrogenase family)
MVEKFIELGHTVLGCGRTREAIETLRHRYQGAHDFALVDVARESQVEPWAARLLSSRGTPDLLINNAAIINQNAPLWQVPAEEFDLLVDANVKGVANVIRHFVPAMVARKSGVIVNMSSGWGRSVAAEVAPYCASKWAIEGLTLALAEELPRGMAAVPLDPGVVFSAADVPNHLDLRGMIAVLLGSFTAGRNDAGGHPEDPAGDRNAVSRLAQRLLGARPGGAVSVVGLVDRLMGFSFPGATATGLHRQAVIGTIRALTRGQRVGHASQAFDETYASAVALLNDNWERIQNGQKNDLNLNSLETVTAALRNVVLLGDPAVRLPAASIGTQPR